MSWPPPNYAENAAFGTGYKVAFDAFRHLTAYPSSQPTIARLFKAWYGYDIIGQEENVTVQSPEGQRIDLLALHNLIQSDPQKQYELYQSAMALWH